MIMMKMIYLITFVLIIAVGLLWYLKEKKPQMPESRLNERTIRQIDQTYLGLRGRVFESTPEDIGLTSPSKEQAYAIIMDISLGNDGYITLVSVADGNASIYVSSGGAIIGGVAHESVRKAAMDFVGQGDTYVKKMTSVDSFPLPGKDQARFYVLTNRGKYSIEEDMDKIENGKSYWESLFYSGDRVITELRRISENK